MHKEKNVLSLYIVGILFFVESWDNLELVLLKIINSTM